LDMGSFSLKAGVSDEIIHPVSGEQVLSTVANCGTGSV
jgi:hypothetical protein